MNRRDLTRFLSHESGPLAQFVKYGVIGVLATCVQMIGFYLLAVTCLKCLGADDWAVRYAGLPSVDVSDGVRAFRAAVATAGGSGRLGPLSPPPEASRSQTCFAG